jgi:hypothetical protein
MPFLGRSLRKLWAQPWQNWGMLLHAGILTVLVRTSLSAVSLKQMKQGLRRTAQGLPQWATSSPTYRRRAAWAARVVGRRLLPERPCLTQALVLQYLLLRRGDTSAQLHIGVAKCEGEGFRAHAWVGRAGDVLIGGPTAPDKYERFDDLSTKLEAQESPGPSSGWS